MEWWRQVAPFGALTLLALLLRLVDLGAKPYHHDESLHAWFGWRLATGEGYAYDPVYHGPVQFYLIAFADLLFGADDYISRTPVAFVGSAAVFLPFFLRRQLGSVAAVTAAAVLCVSPSFLYFSRFLREDIHVATVTLGLFIVLLRFFDEPRRWHPPALLGLLAVSFATKETTYIAVFVAGLFLLSTAAVAAVRARRSGRRAREEGILSAVLSLGWDAWAWGLSAFLVVFTLLFSSLLTNPAGLHEGLYGGVDYWLAQQPVNRGGAPWFYYLALVPAYEWPVVLLGVIGIAAVLRRPSLGGVFLVWMFGGSLAVYSWASERMPWLILHPLLPLVLLAGIGAQMLWRARRRVAARVALAFAAVTAAGALVTSFGLSYARPADAAELLVQVQTSPDVPGIRDELVRLHGSLSNGEDEQVTLTVDNWGGTGWPWAWYLRDLPVEYHDMSRPEGVRRGPIVLVADPNHEAMRPTLHGYVGHRYRLRVWWVPEWGEAGPLEWLRWTTQRQPWSPTATMDQWLYVRRDAAAASPGSG